jgi:hypothetical protein
MVVGAFFICSALIHIASTFLSPVEKNGLVELKGQLLHVSKCSGGRRSSLNYSVSSSEKVVEFSVNCPSSLQDMLPGLIGSEVTILYANGRDLFLQPSMQVFDFTSEELSLVNVDKMISQKRESKWIHVALYMLFGFVGLIFGLHGWAELKSLRKADE